MLDAGKAAQPQAVLHGEFGAVPARGGSRYALTLTEAELQVQRLSPKPDGERRWVLALADVLGCRAAGARGEGCAFAVYAYPPRARQDGGARKRVVKWFRADGSESESENRELAERWRVAIRCLVTGVRLTGETDIVAGLLPRRRRYLLLVNPFSGRGLSMQYCQSHILPMISEAEISYNLIRTEYKNHARELIRAINLCEWDGIVIVSGDGLLHEVINGLMEREDWEKAIRIPVGIVPCGSGNALAGAINHNAGHDLVLGENLLINCTFLLCRGLSCPMDLVSVTTSCGRRRFSFLSVAWGFVSDVDIESERFRGMGAARFTVGTLVRLASLRTYRGRLSYLPVACPNPRNKRQMARSITVMESLQKSTSKHSSVQRTTSDMGLSRAWREPETPETHQEEEEAFPSDSQPPPPAQTPREPGNAHFLPGQEAGSVGGHLDPAPGGFLPPQEVGQGGDRARATSGAPPGQEVRQDGDHLASPTDFLPGQEVDSIGPGGGLPGSETTGFPRGEAGRPLGPPDDLLRPLAEATPPGWESLEAEFVSVLVLYQTHLGQDLIAAPQAAFGDATLHLCYIRAGISRRALLRVFLAMQRGNHYDLDCPYLTYVPVRAFRLEPLTPRGILTVDGERVEYGPIQGQVHAGLANLITGVEGVQHA